MDKEPKLRVIMSGRAKIVLCGPWPPPHGGVSTHMVRLYEILKSRGINVEVLGYGEFIPNKDIKKIYYTSDELNHTLKNILSSVSSGELLHSHSMIDYTNDYFVKMFTALIKIKRIKWVITLHDETLITTYGQLEQADKERLIYLLSSARKIMTVGDNLKKFLVTNGIPEEKITTITPLLPTSEMNSNCTSYLDINDFIKSHSPVICTVGAAIPSYDFLTITQAFKEVKKQYVSSGLIIINSRFASDKDYEKRLREEFNSLSTDIKVLTDIEHETVISILSRSDLFVRGALRESFGLSRIEAILLGKPVIATDTGVTKHMLLYKHGDIEELYRQMLNVLNHSLTIDHDEARSYYNKMANDNIKKIFQIYNELNPGIIEI